jgi:hypothetical protein
VKTVRHIWTCLALFVFYLPTGAYAQNIGTTQHKSSVEEESINRAFPDSAQSDGSPQKSESNITPLTPSKNAHRKHPLIKPIPNAANTSPAARVGYELIGSVAGYAVAIIPAIPIGLVTLSIISGGLHDSESDGGVGGIVILALAGVVGFEIASLFTLPLGVYIAGNAAGGDGSFWLSFLLDAIGAAGGCALAFSAADIGAGIFLILPTLQISGAVIGYELTVSNKVAPRASSYEGSSSQKNVSIYPSVNVVTRARGVVVGVTGIY